MPTSSEINAASGIAVIGLSGRFPGARNVEELWANLRAGRETIRRFTEEELRAAGVPSSHYKHPNYVPVGGVLEEVDQFDAGLFGFTPQEAAVIDPQLRVWLECCWEALEHSGHAPEWFEGLAGVFGGVSTPAYGWRNVAQSQEIQDHLGLVQAMISNDKDFLATWAAYKLNLKGPAVTVQTACSTSLVAIHHACQSLLHFECDLALAGGSSISIPHHQGYLYHEGGILSPDGHCRPFDAEARGTVRGSGVGVVVLRRLQDALDDGDHIWAVIASSAINNDGSHKIGFTAPSIEGQAEVVALAQALARVEPEQISYIEAHGTATPLGDPIEVAALTRVFREKTARKQFCALGSIKSNFGHLDAAAGVTGLIKTVLALHHRELPPSLHFKTPNPKTDLANSPFHVPQTLTPWSGPGPRWAGVSSFGIGGTNAHAILCEAPVVLAPAPVHPPTPQLICLSAQSESALETMTSRLLHHLDDHPELALTDVAHTLHLGRTSLSHRRMVVATDTDDLADALDTRDPLRLFSAVIPDLTRPLAFLFPGQGSAYPGMARALYQTAPFFAPHLDATLQALGPAEAASTKSYLLNQTEAPGTEASLALFVMEYALAQTLMSLGLEPSALIGHSLGEFVCATLSGVMTLPEALTLIRVRSQLVSSLPPGALLAVSASVETLRPFLDARISLALVNAPAATVLAGTQADIAALRQQLEQAGQACRILDTPHAYHSHLMEPVLEDFRAAFTGMTLRPPSRPFISNLTGTWITPEEATQPDYWVRQLRRTVLFSEGLQTLLKDQELIGVETGPGRTLGTLALQHKRGDSHQFFLSLLPDARETKPARALFLETLGRLWLAGRRPSWPNLYQGQPSPRRIPLPTYPFARQRHWIDPAPAQAVAPVLEKRPRLEDWFYTPVWRQLLSRSVPPDHAPGNLVIYEPKGPDYFQDLVVFLQGQTHPLDLRVLTRQTLSVQGEPVDPARSLLLGPIRSLPHEFPGSTAQLIDLDQADNPLLPELLHRPPEADAIALRQRTVWHQFHQPFPLTASSPHGGPRRFWITGGLGGLGFALARHLAQQEEVQLMLTSRQSEPKQEEQRQWLAEHAGRVIFCRADVTDVAAMEAAMEQARARFGGIDTILHAAGVPSGKLLALLKADEAARVLAPKVVGAQILADLVQKHPVKEVILFGSQTAWLGGLGQADYTAANCYLQAMTTAQAGSATSWITLDWDGWQEVGMAANTKVPAALQQAHAARLALGLTPPEGCRALDLILNASQRPAHLLISAAPFELHAQQARATQKEAPRPVPDGPRHARPSLATAYLAPHSDQEKIITSLWEKVLGLGPIGVQDNFFELGGDSFTALRATALLNEHLQSNHPATLLYNCPTPRLLAQKLFS